MGSDKYFNGHRVQSYYNLHISIILFILTRRLCFPILESMLQQLKGRHTFAIVCSSVIIFLLIDIYDNYTNFVLTCVRQATHCCSFGPVMRSLAEMLTSSSHPSWLRDSPPLSMLSLVLKKWPKRCVSALLLTNYAYHCHTAPLSWPHDHPYHHQIMQHS